MKYGHHLEFKIWGGRNMVKNGVCIRRLYDKLGKPMNIASVGRMPVPTVSQLKGLK